METFSEMTLQWVVLVVMVFGLFSLLIPVIPGLVVIWAGALVYGLAGNFTLGGGILFAIISVLALVGSFSDEIFMGASARQSGASWLAIAAALAAGLVGTLLWTPIGGLFAALLGIFLVEFYRLRDWRKALDSTRGMALGCGWAVIARFGIGVVMILLYAWWAFWM
ncbi:MAG TPA: DUF456 domain-containing protein [Chloroflexi bacterium]|nr:DUF456 domain-containing protein [Chloroflexota bacterium]